MTAYVQDAIVLFGDSITQGAWEKGGLGQQLSHVYARKYDILNRGFSGYNTEWAIPVAEQIFPSKAQQDTSPAVRLLVIWFGANDARFAPYPQHVPIERFEANLRNLVDMIQSPASDYHSPSTRIILITPPPVDRIQWTIVLQNEQPPILEMDRSMEVTQKYAEVVKRVAKDRDVAVVDIFTEMWDAAGRKDEGLSQFLSDGLHLSANGYDVVYRMLMDRINEAYPDIHYTRLEPVFPPWATIDVDNPSVILKRR